ncbi:MAG TPA: hypothetical protein VFL64_12805 [Rhizobacter sp.]|nr:hypothetical protein [Rhizobacter sp.]
MKRATVASDVSMIVRGAGAPRAIPPGPCWVLEGPHWIALMWHEGGERHTAEISQRDYAAFLERGCIQFADAPADAAGPALLRANHREQHTPVAALNSRW